MTVLLSTIIYSALTFIVIIFQIALALGKPWGEYAMGGKFPGKYPISMRIATIFPVMILILTEIVILTKAGYIFPNLFSFSQKAIWIIVILSMLGAILNSITPSKKERKIWAPVSYVLLICALLIAIK